MTQVLRSLCCRKNVRSCACRYWGLSYGTAFEETVSVDRFHVGGGVCAAHITLQQMKKTTDMMSLGQLKFRLNWEHLKFITDQQKLLEIKNNYDTFPIIYFKVTKSKFSV